MQKTSPLITKSETFALQIIDLSRMLIFQKREYVLSKQFLRSGTSIGANIAESQYAQSRKDFASKLSIALKESRETQYWLILLQKSGLITESTANSLQNDLGEIIAMLVASVKTTKSK